MTWLNTKIHAFDNNLRLWVGVAILIGVTGLAGVLYVGFTGAHTAAVTAKQQAVRDATIKSDYRACLKSIPTLNAVSKHIGGVNDFDSATQSLASALADLADTLSQNSVASIEAAPPGDQLMATRRANLRRLIAAEASVAAAREEMRIARLKVAAVRSFPVPTPPECLARRIAEEKSGG